MIKNALILLIIISILATPFFSSAAVAPGDDGSAVQIADKKTGILAEINYETLDDDAFDLLREYYNNYSLSNEKLFERYISLKKSYISALESLYNTNYLGNVKKNSETAMRIYYEGKDTLFGLDADVYLYNIAVYENNRHTEQTHLDIIVPVHSTMSVLTVRFTIPIDQLGTSAANTVSILLSGIRYKDLSPQYEAPAVLYNRSVIGRAKLGVYPAADQEDPPYSKFNDDLAGYTVSVPESYIPFVQNSLGGVFTYSSFKINPNIVFSIFSEPLNGNGADDAINRFKVTSLSTIDIIDIGSNYFGNNKFDYVRYTAMEDGVKKYLYDYYIHGGGRLYKLQLQSNISEPGANVKKQVEKILASFNITKTGANYSSYLPGDKPDMLKYINREEGYSFEYPENWHLEEISEDIAYDRLKLNIPGLSGALDITFQESGIRSNVKFIDIIKSVEGTSVSSWPYLTVNYDPPFKDKTSKLLCSDFEIDGPVSIIYRLSAYIDEYGRNRLCYSVDILKGNKIYSMFITSGEYNTEAGRFTDNRINEMINMVASSFRLENTPESEARRISGETRNRKVVFVENYLKRLIDSKLKITSVEKEQPDRTSIIAVGNTDDSGYYKIRLDYANMQVEILDRVLISDILQTELARLKEQYKDKKIISTALNEQNMTISIEFNDNNIPIKMKHIYLVNVSAANGRISWETRRIANREDYIYECGLFVKAMFDSQTEVHIYGEKVFADLETYRRKGLMYPVLVNTQSKDIEKTGFIVLSMNPATSTFSPASNFIPLDNIVDDIIQKYEMKYSGKYTRSYEFDPKSFMLDLTFTDSSGSVIADEQFVIYYHPEEGEIKYEKVNSRQPGKHQ